MILWIKQPELYLAIMGSSNNIGVAIQCFRGKGHDFLSIPNTSQVVFIALAFCNLAHSSSQKNQKFLEKLEYYSYL